MKTEGRQKKPKKDDIYYEDILEKDRKVENRIFAKEARIDRIGDTNAQTQLSKMIPSEVHCPVCYDFMLITKNKISVRCINCNFSGKIIDRHGTIKEK